MEAQKTKMFLCSKEQNHLDTAPAYRTGKIFTSCTFDTELKSNLFLKVFNELKKLNVKKQILQLKCGTDRKKSQERKM